MIRRYVSHIPARHFKMIRYYGFLANRKRGSLLPKVYDALDMIHPNEPEKPGFAALIKGLTPTRTNVFYVETGYVLCVRKKAYMQSLYCQEGGITWRKSDGYKRQPRSSVSIVSCLD